MLRAMTWLLSVEVDRVYAEIRDLSPDRCVTSLETTFQDLERLLPGEVDPDDLRENGAATLGRVWETRQLLHEQLQTMYEQETLTVDCLRSIRRADLAGRYLADYLYGALHDLPSGPPPPWLLNPAIPFQGPEDLRSGDILVTRGDAVSSAGIAHMGRLDSQFSHNVLIYVDPRNGKKHTVEAYLERGALTQPLDHLLEHGIERIVVLRHPDADLASRAAAAAYERIRHGRRIDYDADFDFQNHDGLFCSEVPRWAYGELVGGPEDVPFDLALTVFEHDKNKIMFQAMGIETAVTSAPSDILYDPRFEVVGEWRNPEHLPRLRHQDAVVESVMHWMEDLDYRLHVQGRHRNTVAFGLFVRRLPVLGAALKHKIHPRGDKEFLAASLALFEVALAVDEDFEAALVGREEPVTYAEMREILEGLRQKDLATFRADPKEARYHGVLSAED
jgi:hypothetical protein